MERTDEMRVFWQAKHTFARYETLNLPGAQPPPEAALALLYRLASDPGILAIMDKHKWNVGVLKEMPPEGKVRALPALRHFNPCLAA